MNAAVNEATEKEFIAKNNKKYIVLAIYDISNTKRRNKMITCLEQYAIRVQKSAFEGYLTQRQYTRLMDQAHKLINPKTDSLRVYLLASHTSVRSWGIGDVHRDDVIIL